jgi:hypothetical protein
MFNSYAYPKEVLNCFINFNVNFHRKYVYPLAEFFNSILRGIYAVIVAKVKSMISLTGRACDIGTIFKVFVRTFAQNFEFFSPQTPSLTTQPTESSPKRVNSVEFPLIRSRRHIMMMMSKKQTRLWEIPRHHNTWYGYN